MPHTPEARRLWRIQRANAIRTQLIEQLGGECAECGSTENLQINHIYQRSWKPRTLTHYRRILRYRQEAADGLVNLLCESCNAVYRPLPLSARPTVATLATQPF